MAPNRAEACIGVDAQQVKIRRSGQVRQCQQLQPPTCSERHSPGELMTELYRRAVFTLTLLTAPSPEHADLVTALIVRRQHRDCNCPDCGWLMAAASQKQEGHCSLCDMVSSSTTKASKKVITEISLHDRRKECNPESRLAHMQAQHSGDLKRMNQSSDLHSPEYRSPRFRRRPAPS